MRAKHDSASKGHRAPPPQEVLIKKGFFSVFYEFAEQKKMSLQMNREPKELMHLPLFVACPFLFSYTVISLFIFLCSNSLLCMISIICLGTEAQYPWVQLTIGNCIFTTQKCLLCVRTHTHKHTHVQTQHVDRVFTYMLSVMHLQYCHTLLFFHLECGTFVIVFSQLSNVQNNCLLCFFFHS